MLRNMQTPSFDIVKRVIEEDHRPTCENEVQAKTEGSKKLRKCGSRMVKAVLFQTAESKAQWMCPACTVHLIELSPRLSAELSERVWVAVRRDPQDPFWGWVPQPMRGFAAKHGFGTNSHGPRRTTVAFHCEVWCDDGYACVRMTDHSLMGPVEAMREADAQARDADLVARQSMRDEDDGAHLETLRLLRTHALLDEAHLRTMTNGPEAPSAVKAPAPSKNKMMLNKNATSTSHVGATFAFKIGDVRVPPEHFWMLEEVHGTALSWYEHEQCVLGVVNGAVAAIIRSVGARAAAPELDEADVDDE